MNFGVNKRNYYVVLVYRSINTVKRIIQHINFEHTQFKCLSLGTEVKIAAVRFVELDLPEESTVSRMKIIAVILAVIATSSAAPYGNYKHFIK